MNYIFTNARIIPMDIAGFSPHGSLLVQDGMIAMLGTLSDCRAASNSATEIIDLKGKHLLPAFTDTHTHFVELAKMRFQIDLSGCSSIDQYRERFQKYIDTHSDIETWTLGSGWDKNSCDAPELIQRKLLDEFFPDRPVALYSKDYHSRWCNSLALKICGIDADLPDPPGGKIAKDSSGQPTGILLDSAAELIDEFIQHPSDMKTTQTIRDSISDIYRYGLISIHSMEAAASARLLERVIRSDASLRVCWHFPLDKLDEMIGQGIRSYTGDDWFQIGGVKIFADGSLGSQTAAIDHVYPGSMHNTGILRYTYQELSTIARHAADNGISCSIHAIGVRAVRTVIDVFLHLKETHPQQSLLQRIEHLQSISPEDMERLQRSGAYCAMQPVHLANDIDMIERNWAPIRDHAYTFRSLWDLCIPIGFGSDAPIETINPFHGIYGAITRKKALNPSEPSWHAAECITAMDALYAYTLGAARGSCSEQKTGSITPGKLADVIVLDDFTNQPDEFWLAARSRLTMLGGRIVWSEGL